MSAAKMDIISQLQKDLLPLQGFKPPTPGARVDMGLGPLEDAFPNGVFPTGAVHEFLTTGAEDGAASSGLIAGLLGQLMQKAGICVWIGCRRTIFPSGLKAFGIAPERLIFIDLKRERDVLWAMEEALKCEGLAAVVGEVRDIDFTASRRLQLAVEASRVTGFILRPHTGKLNTVACVARWTVKPLGSTLNEGLPGVGFPRWKVDLLKVRNGYPGAWTVEWAVGIFRVLPERMGSGAIPLPEAPRRLQQEPKRQTG